MVASVNSIILGDKNRIKANFLIGDNLMRGLTELAKIIQDDNSNLTIGSSRSFEGSAFWQDL